MVVDAANKFKLILLGDKDAGKSSLTIRFCLNHYINKQPISVSDTYRKQIVVDAKPSLIEIMDASASDEDSYLYYQWFNEVHAALILYPVTSHKAFENLESYWDEVERVRGFDEYTKRPNIPIFLVGTMGDCPDDEREVSAKEGREKAQNWGCHFFEVSARTDENVQDLFADVVKTLRPSKEINTTTPAILENKKEKKNFKRFFCCF